jgi:hypothetical protein
VVKPVVEVAGTIPGGSVVYREGERVHEFGWDLGARDVVMTIYVPAPGDWDARIPWAAGRRDEVLATLAREVSRQKCRACDVEIAERWIYLREPPPLPKRVVDAFRRFVASFRDGA